MPTETGWAEPVEHLCREEREKSQSIELRFNQFGFNFNESGEMTECTAVQSKYSSVVLISVQCNTSQWISYFIIQPSKKQQQTHLREISTFSSDFPSCPGSLGSGWERLHRCRGERADPWPSLLPDRCSGWPRRRAAGRPGSGCRSLILTQLYQYQHNRTKR